jgi:hypothetical protein
MLLGIFNGLEQGDVYVGCVVISVEFKLSIMAASKWFHGLPKQIIY